MLQTTTIALGLSSAICSVNAFAPTLSPLFSRSHHKIKAVTSSSTAPSYSGSLQTFTPLQPHSGDDDQVSHTLGWTKTSMW